MVEATPLPAVAIVVLNWNNYEASAACLASLLKLTYPNYQVILVDNGSTDGSADRLQADMPDLAYIRNDRNLGFAAGCNVGIRRAWDQGFDYVLLLNNDCILTPNSLEPAVAVAMRDDRIGLVGGKLYVDRDARIISYAGGEMRRLIGGPRIFGWGRYDDGRYDEIREVGFVTGAMMLIKRAVLERVGLLPEVYFFGGEEYDYCLTVRDAGFSLCYVPGFEAYHHSDGSHSNKDPKYIYNSTRNKLLLQQRHLPSYAFQIWRIVYTLYVSTYARLRVPRLQRRHGSVREPWEIHFAMRTALARHSATEGTSEADLSQFSRMLDEARRNR